jgi:hypothetical protein
MVILNAGDAPRTISLDPAQVGRNQKQRIFGEAEFPAGIHGVEISVPGRRAAVISL